MIKNSLKPGTYLLKNNKLKLLKLGADLFTLRSENELLITPWVSHGEKVSNGERLAVIQRRGRMTTMSDELKPEIVNVTELIRRYMLMEKH